MGRSRRSRRRSRSRRRRGSSLTLGRRVPRARSSSTSPNEKLRAINVVPLEQYLYGVVPAEMPSSWLPAALEAQAVAARSYALASRKAERSFDVYADGRSQAYLGVSAETPAGQAAVDETAGQVLLYGRRRRDDPLLLEHRWPDAVRCRRVRRPGGRISSRSRIRTTPISPYHDWGPVPVTGKTLGQRARRRRPPRRRDRQAQLVAAREDAQDHFALARARSHGLSRRPRRASALGLRSTWFSVGVLSLQPPSPNPAVAAGHEGQAERRRARRPAASSCRSAAAGRRVDAPPGGRPRPEDGAFHFTVKPKVTTAYRLATAQDAAASVRIRVEAATVK